MNNSDNPDEEIKNCRLLGFEAIIIQIIFCSIMLSFMIFKKHLDVVKRPWIIWLMVYK